MHLAYLTEEQICKFGEGKISLTKDIITEILSEAKSSHTKELGKDNSYTFDRI